MNLEADFLMIKNKKKPEIDYGFNLVGNSNRPLINFQLDRLTKTLIFLSSIKEILHINSL